MTFNTDQPAYLAPRLGLRAPSDLVTAVAPLLGFYPTESLVLVAVGFDGQGRYVRYALRVDLPAPGMVDELVRHLCSVLRTKEADELLLAVVGGGRPTPDAPPHQALVERLSAQCAQLEVPVVASVWAAEVRAGAAWRCYGECGCAGALPDPASTPLAAAMVAAGQVTYRDRGELAALVREGDVALLARRSAALEARMDWLCADDESAAASSADGFALLARWVSAPAAERSRLDDADVVALCLALSDPVVRDAALGFCLGAQAWEAERLWRRLVVEFPDPEAAEPATLLGFSALQRGDGALANVALERAQRAWPGHRLSAGMLRALAEGVDVGQLTARLAEAVEQANLALAEADGPGR